MHFGNGMRIGEPEPGTLMLSVERGAEPMKRF